MPLQNLFSLFESKPATTVVDNKTVPNSDTIKSDGKTVAAIPAAGEGDKSPLAGFDKLWETTTNDTGENRTRPMFANDPQKLLEAARTIDFAKVIPAELTAKIAAGGEGAAAAFSAAINAVSQQAYAQSAHATTRLIEAALIKQREQMLAEIPAMVRQHSISETLRGDNPLFTNPATAPLLEVFQDRLAKLHPTATAETLKQMSRQYLTEFAQVVNDTNKAATTPATTASGSMRKTGADGENWEDFFGVKATS